MTTNRFAVRRRDVLKTIGAGVALGAIGVPVLSRPAVAAEEAATCIDFSSFGAGDSVEGAGVLYDGLTISSAGGNAVVQKPGETPGVYGANGSPNPNACMDEDGGFGDLASKEAAEPQEFSFAFDEALSVFSVRMLDFGDYNPTGATTHVVAAEAYDGSDALVDSQTLEYTSSGWINPSPWTPVSGTTKTNASMRQAGDACEAADGEPGDYTWSVSGSGIRRVELTFGDGYDPNVGFDTLCFTEEPTCVPCDLAEALKYE